MSDAVHDTSSPDEMAPSTLSGGAPTGDVLDEIAAVADAVLFEGYLLYPYRASAQKNRVRWQFGVLTPAADPLEPTRNRTECLIEPAADTELRFRLRFLRLQTRQPHTSDGTAVEQVLVDGARHMRFEEGIPVHIDATFALADLLASEHTVPIDLPAQESTEELRAADGALAGQLVRTSSPVTGRLVISAVDLPGPYLVHRLRFDVINDSDVAPGAPREVVLQTSLIAGHTMVVTTAGRFLSLTAHPRWAEPATKECVNEHTWPVLAGPEGRSDLLLSSPIILHDHAQLAPESTLNLFDGLENDEILTLRTLTLTEDEKAEARATDPRAAQIIDAVDAMPPEILERLHGAIRSLRPASRAPVDDVPTFGTSRPFGVDNLPFGADSPEQLPPASVPWWNPAADSTVNPDTDTVLIDGVPVANGSKVVLRPGRNSDAQDRFLDGMHATVHAVVHDVDGGIHLAVSVDGDPGAEMQLAHGRFRYFRPEEIEVAP